MTTEIVLRGRPRKNYSGEVFGPLTVLSAGEDVIYCRKKRSTVLCRCICGDTFIVRTDQLRSFKARTGCYCNRAPGRPKSLRVPMMLDWIVQGKTNVEIMQEFDIRRPYVMILRRRVAKLTEGQGGQEQGGTVVGGDIC